MRRSGSAKQGRGAADEAVGGDARTSISPAANGGKDVELSNRVTFSDNRSGTQTSTRSINSAGGTGDAYVVTSDHLPGAENVLAQLDVSTSEISLPPAEPVTWVDIIGLVAHGIMAAFSIAEIVLACIIGHGVGICFSVITLLWLVFIGFVAHYKFLEKFKVVKMDYFLRTPIPVPVIITLVLVSLFLYGYTLGMFWVRVLSTAPKEPLLPIGCDESLSCLHTDVFDDGSLITLNTHVDEVISVCSDWVELQFLGKVEETSPGYMHAVILSTLVGFTDDLYVHASCNQDTGQTVVWAKVRERMLDADSVDEQVNELLAYVAEQPLPPIDCRAPSGTTDPVWDLLRAPPPEG